MIRNAAKSFRLHIGIFGRRNTGKSSLLNAITRQQVSIVSPDAGTTTDPVEKPMELHPIGPVLFIDTAGIDDEGALGQLRIEKTRQAFDRTDIAVLVTEAGRWGEFEQRLAGELRSRHIPVVIAANKIDLAANGTGVPSDLPIISMAAPLGIGIEALRETLARLAPVDWQKPVIVSDLVNPGELAVLVTPIDKEAPKGRLIQPQVQVIRELLDNNAFCVVVKEHQLRIALDHLKQPPKIVVTDSQALRKVAADTPPDIWLTSFSILFARLKGDLPQMSAGAAAIEQLRSGDRVLIAEACAHHPIEEDIGRVKIPLWLKQYTGTELFYDTCQGHAFPEDLTPYSLVVHCGACMWNRREVLARIERCHAAGVPITNYGLAIAYSLGFFERVLEPFPEALGAFRAQRTGTDHKPAPAGVELP